MIILQLPSCSIGLLNLGRIGHKSNGDWTLNSWRKTCDLQLSWVIIDLYWLQCLECHCGDFIQMISQGPAVGPSTIPHSWWMRFLAGRWQGGRLCCYRTAPPSTGLLKAKSPGRVLNVRPFINHNPAACFWGPVRPHTELGRRKKKLSVCAEKKLNHRQVDTPRVLLFGAFFLSWRWEL